VNGVVAIDSSNLTASSSASQSSGKLPIWLKDASQQYGSWSAADHSRMSVIGKMSSNWHHNVYCLLFIIDVYSET